MVATLGELHEVLASRPSFLLRQSKNGGIVRGAGSADMSALLAAATSLRQTCRAEFGSRSLRSGAYEGGTRRSIAVHSVGGAGLHTAIVLKVSSNSFPRWCWTSLSTKGCWQHRGGKSDSSVVAARNRSASQSVSQQCSQGARTTVPFICSRQKAHVSFLRDLDVDMTDAG